MLVPVDPRTRLLEAAIDCLQERGYARTTTRDIVAAAGSHLPAVNYYFGSKERLLSEAIVEALRRWTDSAMAVGADPAAPTSGERLRRSLEAFLADLRSDRRYVVAAAEAFAQAARSETLRDRLAEEYRLTRAQVADDVVAAVAGPSGDTDAAAVASVLMALFDGLAIQWLLAPDEVPDAGQVMRALGLLAGTAATGRQGAAGDTG